MPERGKGKDLMVLLFKGHSHGVCYSFGVRAHEVMRRGTVYEYSLFLRSKSSLVTEHLYIT